MLGDPSAMGVGGGIGGVPANSFSANVWVGNLPLHLGESDLETIFGQFGVVTSVKVLRDRTTGGASGAGMVNFSTLGEALAAVSGVNGKVLPGSVKPLVARLAESKKDRSPPALGTFLGAGPGLPTSPAVTELGSLASGLTSAVAGRGELSSPSAAGGGGGMP
eukprot:RCo035704